MRHVASRNLAEPTGFPGEELPSCAVPGERRERPVSLAWIDDDLLARTREVWSKVAGKPIDEDEAVEILTERQAAGRDGVEGRAE